MISIILSAATLNSSLPFTHPTGSNRTNWIAVIATMRCKGFQASVLPFLRSERRGLVVSQQGVDVRLQVHDLHQFLADKLSGLFASRRSSSGTLIAPPSLIG